MAVSKEEKTSLEKQARKYDDVRGKAFDMHTTTVNELSKVISKVVNSSSMYSYLRTFCLGIRTHVPMNGSQASTILLSFSFLPFLWTIYDLLSQIYFLKYVRRYT